MGVASRPSKSLTLPLVGGLCVFVLATLAYGAWYGFPIQDDTYMIRLLRMGGPERLVEEHPDRPVFGRLLAACAGFAGERKGAYVAIGLIGWSLFAAQSIRLWTRLFPRWSSAAPVIGLAVVSPVIHRVQFSTVTTLIPCVLPVMLVLAGLLLLLRADARPRTGALVAAFLLSAAAALVSEYGLAAAAGAATLLLLLGRWRSSAVFLAGAPIGYAIFHATAKLSLRLETNPVRQAGELLSRPWTRPLRVASAAWSCVAGAWGQAASEFRVDLGSKSTVLAALLGVAVAAVVAVLWRADDGQADPGAARTVLALVGAVFAGLFPAIAIMGWPLRLTFETRFLLPVVPFASCATVAVLLLALRARWARAALCAVAFLAADRLVLQAVGERRTQAAFEAVGEKLLSFVGDEPGLVILVMRDRDAQSKEEIMAEATYRWRPVQSSRLVIVRPEEALLRFGPRSGCRSLDALILRQEVIRWPRAKEPIRLLLWDQGDLSDLDPEPYFRGCPGS